VTTSAPKALELARWLDVLETSPLVAGDARFLRAYFLPAHGQYRESVYRAALAGMQGAGLTAQALARRGRIRRLLGDRRGAETDFGAALKLDARCSSARAFRAEMTLTEDPRAAVPELEAALDAEPRNAAYVLWLGYAQALSGDLAGAVKRLDRAAALNPKGRAARVLRGILRERLDDLAGAESDYSAVARLDPACPGIYTLRATVRWKRGDRKRSVADANRALVLHPENMDAFMRIVYLFKDLKHPEEKRSQGALTSTLADEVLRGDPRCAWAYALKAEVVEDAEVSKKADKKTLYLKKALALDPRNAWMRAFLGRAMTGLRDDPRVIRLGLKQLDRAVALAPEIGWIRSWRAEVLDKLGEGDRALKDLDRGIEADPDYRLANAWRASLRARRGDDAGAVEDLTACVAVMPRAGFFHQRAVLRWRLGEASGAAADLTSSVARATRQALGYSRFGWLLRFEWSGSARARNPGSLIRSRRSFAAARRGAGTRLEPLEKGAFKSLVEAIPGCELRAPWKGLPLDAAKLSEACAADPRDAALRAWLGRVLLDAGRFDAAEEALSSSLALDGRGFPALAWRGEARFGRGDLAGALADLDEAAASTPAHLPARLWRALTLWSLGREPQALDELLSACRADPASSIQVSVWARWTIPGFFARLRKLGPPLTLAEFFLYIGRPLTAAVVLDRSPSSELGPGGRILRGLAAGQLGSLERAEDEFARAVSLDARAAARMLDAQLMRMPGVRKEIMAAAYHALGDAEVLAGGEEASRRAYATAAELDGAAEGSAPRRATGLAAALMTRARVRREAGDLQGALEDARKAAGLRAKTVSAGAPR
jgi:tetratricopeptide (TPR) repeat protein